jgi:ATP-dependent Clp protease ATP-binding subunit ClpX
MQIDTSNILFICAGAFEGIEDLIRRRMKENTMGFRSNPTGKKDEITDVLQGLLPEDLLKFGLIPEFIGRLPVIATLDILDEDALVKILSEPRNAILKQYTRFFELDGVDLVVEPAALREVAREAIKRKTGARGLRSILEHTLLNTMFDLPSMENVVKVVVDEGTITSDAAPLLIYSDQPKVAGSTV